MSERLPITAVVVSRNEAAFLERCLPTLQFCEEVLVIDLESVDETVSVATAHGAEVIRHPVEQTVERVRNAVLDRARHDWVLTTDPDEELPLALQEQLVDLFPSIPDDIAIVAAPIKYYFGGHALKGTTWGGVRHRRLLVRRSGVELSSTIYSGTLMRDGYGSMEVPFSSETAIVHRWSPGYRSLLEKHRRYLRAATDDRFRVGEVTGWRRVLSTPSQSFVDSFFRQHGYRDGLTGLGLSLFWAGFRTADEVALLRRLRGNGCR